MSLWQPESSDIYSLPVPPSIKLEAGCANTWIPSPLPSTEPHLDIHAVSCSHYSCFTDVSACCCTLAYLLWTSAADWGGGTCASCTVGQWTHNVQQCHDFIPVSCHLRDCKVQLVTSCVSSAVEHVFSVSLTVSFTAC